MRSLERLKEYIREWCEETTWDGKAAFRQPNRASVGGRFRQRRDLGNGVIAFAQQNSLAGLELGQVFGEMCLGFMNIELNHDHTLN